MSASSPDTPAPAASGATAGARPGIAGVLALYSLARIGLLAVIAGLLVLAGTPLVIAVLVALVVALPLSMLLFRGLRARLDEAVETARARRAAQRAALRAGLRGSPDPAADPDRDPPPGTA
jgi:threonine/homoserine/homoserine lactone efflux protein